MCFEVEGTRHSQETSTEGKKVMLVLCLHLNEC